MLFNDALIAEGFRKGKKTLQPPTIFTVPDEKDTFFIAISGYLGFYLVDIENEPENCNVLRMRNRVRAAVKDIQAVKGIPDKVKNKIPKISYDQDGFVLVIDFDEFTVRYFNHNLADSEIFWEPGQEANYYVSETCKGKYLTRQIITQRSLLSSGKPVGETGKGSSALGATSIAGDEASEVLNLSSLTQGLFEFDLRAVEIALSYFKPNVDIDQLENQLMKVEGVSLIRWVDNVLTIVGNSEIVKFHLKSDEINERLGLKDRLYIMDADLEQDITVKIYARDERDDKRGIGPVYILGVVRTSHDSGAVLIKDGVVIGAIEEERLDMNKHTRAYFPILATRYLLEEQGVKWEQVNHIATTYDYNWFRDTPHSRAPRDHFHERFGLPELADDKKLYNTDTLQTFLERLAETYGSEYVPPVTFVKHHKTHAAAAWHTSGFPEPTLAVTIDGRGEDEATTVWLCAEGKMKKISSESYIHSLGHLYYIVTKYIGYRSHDEGKVMGFAPYGAARNYEEEERVDKLRLLMDEAVSFDTTTGHIQLDQDCFNFFTLENFPGMDFSDGFLKRLEAVVPKYPKSMAGTELDPDREEHRPYANLAYVLQEKVEESMIRMLEYYLQEYPETKGVKHVVMGGGLSLNIAANGKVIESGVVDADKFFVPAFPADDGTAVGAALSVAEEEYDLNARNIVAKISLGKTYSDEEISLTLDRYGLVEGEDYFAMRDDVALVETVAETLENNRTVAWYQGGAELGPRALGNRSILHRLDDPEGNLKVNEIKNREYWRPSALSIQQERASEFLEGIAVSPFMTIGFKVKDEKRDIIRAGVHSADGTTRPQTVFREANPIYWALLGEMDKRTGIPGVLNTSFNRRGPIIETPEDALNTLYYGHGIDQLAIGHFIVNRTQRLQPSILNLQDEPTLRKQYKDIMDDNYDVSKWQQFSRDLNHLVESRGAAHQHFLTVSSLGSAGKIDVLKIPLCKEMFQRGSREKMIPEMAAYIHERIGRKTNANIVISSTSHEYEDVVISLFERFTPLEIVRNWRIMKGDPNGDLSWGNRGRAHGTDKGKLLIVAGLDPETQRVQPEIMIIDNAEVKTLWGKDRIIKNAQEKIIPQLVQTLIAASENIAKKTPNQKAAILIDTELAEVGFRDVKKEIEKMIKLLANIEGNNEYLRSFLKNLEIVVGKGKDLIKKKGKVKDENVIVVTTKENMQYFDEALYGKAVIAAIDRKDFPKTAYLPLLEVTLFAIGKYLGWNENKIKQHYMNIPNTIPLEMMESANINDLFDANKRTFIIKLIPNAIAFEKNELVEMMMNIRKSLRNA
ncbi:MAG: carbamoyltransferase C-terminal domain-containing protein [Candidatus Omnitrophota bacterium]